MDNTIHLEINNKIMDEEIKNNYQKNIKLNKTDLEVLEKKVNFFLPELLKEPEKIKQKHLEERPQPQLYTVPTIPQNINIIQPINKIRSKAIRGIGMRMF